MIKEKGPLFSKRGPLSLSIKSDHKISFRILRKNKIFTSLLQWEKVAAKPTDEVFFA